MPTEILDPFDAAECPSGFVECVTRCADGRTVKLRRFVPEVFRGVPPVFFVELDGRLVASSDDWPNAVLAFRTFLNVAR